jgi:uncharacterized membrane protein
MEKPAMNVDASIAAEPPAGWRLKLGVAVFVLSVLLPAAGIPLVASLGLSATVTASVSGALLVGAEVLGVLAVASMGKPGYLFIKSRVFGLLRRYGPPKEVSRLRYNIGLVMFILPILFGWVTLYVADLIPKFADNMFAYAIGGDLLLLASLFVLGGDFWDKIRALFVYSDKVCSETKP